MAQKHFRREDIPGIVPRLRDMADPELAAQQLGVPMNRLAARQVLDPSKPGKELVNDFYVKTS